MQLTAHFTYEELVASDYATRHGISNVPSEPHIVGNLHCLAAGLERVRAVIGQPIHVTSGYRCLEVNEAIGGVAKSAHMLGLAADIKVLDLAPRLVALMIAAHPEIGFERVIYEGAWTHVEFPPGGREPQYFSFTAHFHAGRPTTYTQGIDHA